MSEANEAPDSVLFDLLPCTDGSQIGRIRLNRPKALNALNLDMCERMLHQLRLWASDESVAVIWIEGEGAKGFCAGGDVAQVVRQVRAGGPQRYTYGDMFFTVEYELDYLMHTYAKPIVAYSHGVCMGGGVGLMVGCSHRVVAEASRIAMPEIHIGLFPDVGGGYFLNRVPGNIGRVMALTGLTINEADAIFAGLTDYFVPLEFKQELLSQLQALAWQGKAAHEHHQAISAVLLARHRKYKVGLPTANLLQYFDALRFVAMQPSVAHLRDALQMAAKEDPYFNAPAESLSNGSPTAALVSDEYLQRAKTMSLRQVLDLDLVLAKAYQRHHDFPEGVRALLIDKDRQPKWMPTSLEAVDGSLVLDHFLA